MPAYNVIIDVRVRKKDLVRIPNKDVVRIVSKITSLAANPYPEGSLRLRGRDEWRIRQGNYRILYLVDDNVVTVTVVQVGHRRDIYR